MPISAVNLRRLTAPQDLHPMPGSRRGPWSVTVQILLVQQTS